MQTSYAPGKNKWSMEAIERRLSGYMVEQATHGFTKWKLSLADGTFIGRAGWSPWEQDSLEIGYAIKPEFWGNSYATEAACALVTWARLHQSRNALVGFALPNNSASLRILQKIGMEFLHYREISGANFAYYQWKT